MKNGIARIKLLALLMFTGSAIALESSEHKIPSLEGGSPSSYISIACVGGKLNFSIQWNTHIGTAGKYRRHLVLPGKLGDTHILLKVLPEQTRTGIIDNDQQAKALIKLILKSVESESMSIQVFPEGRDLVTGKWEEGSFNYSEFSDAANTVAKECNWDMNKSIATTVRTIIPGAPYEDE